MDEVELGLVNAAAAAHQCSKTPATPAPSDVIAMVREFHVATGCPINDATRTHNSLRALLIHEEAKEARDALLGVDGAGLAEVAKELADLVYVAYGAALTLGIDLDEAVRVVHASNMSKLDPDGQPIMRADGKVLKGPRYQSPDMTAALPRRKAPDGE